MLKIRMQRTGRTNMPSFRIIVTEHTEGPKTGNFVEKLGTYNPKTKERNLNTDRIKHWLSVGAKASGTMHNMLISAGVIEGRKVNVLPRKSPPKVESEPSSAEATEGEQKTDPTGSLQADAGEQSAAKEETPAPESKDGSGKAPEVAAAEEKQG